MATDIQLPWAGDFSLTSKGDIAIVSGGAKVIQRVIRRFLTNAQQTNNLGQVTLRPDYVYHPLYGGNARQYVDALYTAQVAQALPQRFAQQASLESGVAASPPPIVTVQQVIGVGVVMDATVVIADGTVVTVPGVVIQ